jgi:hypothetical protein
VELSELACVVPHPQVAYLILSRSMKGLLLYIDQGRVLHMVGRVGPDTYLVLHLWKQHPIFMEAMLMLVLSSYGNVIAPQVHVPDILGVVWLMCKFAEILEHGRDRGRLFMPPQET